MGGFLFADDFKVQSGAGNDFIKLPESGGAIRFLPLNQAVVGWEYWTNDNKPVRSETKFEKTPGIRVDEKTKKADRPRQFAAFIVWSVEEQKVGILQINQASILKALAEIDAGDDYDLSTMTTLIKVSRTGEGLKTKYTVLPVPVNAKTAPPENWKELADAIDLKKVMFETDADTEEAEVEKAEPQAAPSDLM